MNQFFWKEFKERVPNKEFKERVPNKEFKELRELKELKEEILVESKIAILQILPGTFLRSAPEGLRWLFFKLLKFLKLFKFVKLRSSLGLWGWELNNFGEERVVK